MIEPLSPEEIESYFIQNEKNTPIPKTLEELEQDEVCFELIQIINEKIKMSTGYSVIIFEDKPYDKLYDKLVKYDKTAINNFLKKNYPSIRIEYEGYWIFIEKLKKTIDKTNNNNSSEPKVIKEEHHIQNNNYGEPIIKLDSNVQENGFHINCIIFSFVIFCVIFYLFK